MQLFAGMTTEFVDAATHNAIAQRLADAFLTHFRYRPSPAEFTSWQNSLRSLSTVIERGGLFDHGILLEYQLPLSSRRLDALITGRAERRDRAIIVELKQWQDTKPGSADDLLLTWIGGAHRDVLHPSVQVNQYRRYLVDMHEAFQGENRISLDACAFLHNYTPDPGDALFDPRSDAVRAIAPVFTGGETTRLSQYLAERLGAGGGREPLQRVVESRYRPSKKLLAHVADVIRNEPTFVLLDEQQVVYSQVRVAVESAVKDGRKHVFLVHGGPGTGKSVLAVNLLAELSAAGHNTQHATGSKSFTSTLQRIVGRRAGQQFRYFNQFVTADAGSIDLLICDEAHRIRESSNHRFTRADSRSTRPQIEELVSAAKVAVFLVDDLQVVRPGEVGTSGLIRAAAERNGCVLHERELDVQFRCSGSEAFVAWVENTLAIRKTAHQIFDQSHESFQLQIVDTPDALDAMVRDQLENGDSARIVAGYCWPWSRTLSDEGALLEDVQIGGFRRPWNARPEMRGLPSGVPKAEHWAYEPGGVGQVGCVYTAQGFEFDYVGVIWGRDLRYDFEAGRWIADRAASKDVKVRNSGERFIDLVKNTYRVLLSRGMKGCFIYCEDEATAAFLRSRTEGLGSVPVPKYKESQALPAEPSSIDDRPFQIVALRDARPWENAVPLLDLEIAAGDFSDAQALEDDAIEWVRLPDDMRVRPGQFVARIVGDSMNRRVPSGSWALFSTQLAGTKQGKVVLAERREVGDPEEGGRYTLKIYDAVRREGHEGIVYDSVVLRPDSTDPRYQPIVLHPADEDGPRIIAILIGTLL